ncbi:hypothetical protein RJ641_003707 [Dillenia turbinata]|uniref:Uncharacterized protein n=1 Tax=Dillenia turbinata TaxID=194707 RepID=A0AAN8ZDF2_9MAGN
MHDQGKSDIRRNSGPNGLLVDPTPLKSNLKKPTLVVDQEQQQRAQRKVSWPDAHGKDIAHVQEFEPSVLEDGEQGVRNSCVCTIQ